MKTDWKARAKRLKRDIPAVFLALKRSETPIMAKVLAAVTVAYALSPVDLIPDFIPVLGYLDDLLLLPGLIAMAVKLIPSEVLEQCRVESAHLWESGRPKRWFYALPIMLFWILMIGAAVKALFF